MEILSVLRHPNPSHKKYHNQTEHEMELEEWVLLSTPQYTMIKVMHVVVVILVVLTVIVVILITVVVLVRKRSKIKRWFRETREAIHELKVRYLSAAPHTRFYRIRARYARFLRKARKIRLGLRIGLRVVKFVRLRNVLKAIKGIKMKRILWTFKKILVVKKHMLWALRIAVLILMINVIITLFLIVIMIFMVVVVDNIERNDYLDDDD